MFGNCWIVPQAMTMSACQIYDNFYCFFRLYFIWSRVTRMQVVVCWKKIGPQEGNGICPDESSSMCPKHTEKNERFSSDHWKFYSSLFRSLQWM
jgi:hypothetical protein